MVDLNLTGFHQPPIPPNFEDYPYPQILIHFCERGMQR